MDNVLNFSPGALASTGMRYHELALQRWLNKVFTLRWGVPMPVIFSSPMDAFSEFSKLWQASDSAYRYLLDVKDDAGNPVYLPYPSPVRYPIISVYRRNYKLRQYQNFSINRMRHIAWPTVSDNAPFTHGKVQQGHDLRQGDLGEVITARYPLAMDYRFQIDFFCNRPDTQAFFLTQLFREFWRTGGPTMQTWADVAYPLLGGKLVRLYIDGEVENMTPEVPEEGKNVEFRVSFTIVMEGFEVDVQYEIHPTLWELVIRNAAAVNPQYLSTVFASTASMNFGGDVDMRGESTANPTVVRRTEDGIMPSSGAYAPDTSEL